MSELKEWLKGSKNYQKGVELVERYAPQHSLLSVLQQHSRINEIYLHRTITELSLQAPKTKAPKYRDTKKQSPGHLAADIKRLSTLRAKAHNSYFECKTDDQRKTINRQLRQLNIELNACYRSQEHFQKTGQLPKIAEVTTPVTIPTNDRARLRQLLNNARSNVSKTKRKLDAAYQTKDTAKIEKLEKRLSKYQNIRDAYDDEL